jgi:hypothetical protein
MPRRRGTVCERAVAAVVEHLENRTLLTTVVGGGTDPVTGEPVANTFFYKDADDNVVRVDVGGDTTAEFIFGRVPDNSGAVILNPPAPASAQEGYNLFSVYVAQSNQFSFISITKIDPNTGRLLPFDGDVGALRVSNATTGLSTTVTPSGPGSVLIGAKTTFQSPADNIPILAKRNPGAIGVRPATATLPAGLQIAPGNDFGNFLLGGTILGNVNIGNSINTFYAGNVLTGDARGLPAGTSLPTVHGKRVSNFTVGGNIASLLVGGSIGTDQLAGLTSPDLNTGFDMRVGGIVGQVAVRDAYMGGLDVIHGKSTSPFGSIINEDEGRGVNSAVGDPAIGWASGHLEGSNLVFNNTFDQPQILPSFLGRRGRSTVTATGTLYATPQFSDYVDYYAMPLLAGQDVTAVLRPTGTVAGASNMALGVFDPDGRLILTDYANNPDNAASVVGTPIHFTADRPGLYRFAVGVTTTTDFSNAGLNIGLSPYTLTVTGGGDLALGGVMATNQLTDGKAAGYGFFVENGDMGGLQAGANIFSISPENISVRKGNLRSVEGGTIGVGTSTTQFGSGVNLVVTRGNVGLLRSTADVLVLNTGTSALPLSIGGDYQVISAATTLWCNAITNRGFGVIRAGDFATVNNASVITANADGTGDDGIIDLIDCAGDFGTLTAGGPQITTGPGGNLRYLNVGGTVFRDAFFGGSIITPAVYAPGERIRLTDDSGTTFDIEPETRPNPAFIPGNTNGVSATIGTTVSVIGYPIRGSGGQALVNVTADGNVRIGVGGNAGSRAHAEIGQLSITPADTSQDNPVILDPTTGQPVFQFPTSGAVGDTNVRNLNVLIDGSGTADVFRIQGANLTTIENDTPGEILNVSTTGGGTGTATLGTLGNLIATNIGVGVSHTGAAVNGIQTIGGNTYPFNQQHNGIVSGNMISVEASGAVGNLNVTGSIGTVTANAGGRNTTGTFEGIAGPVVASSNIAAVNIGEGILPTGSGNFSRAGIYAGSIGQVRNQGRGSDVRGDIVATTNIGSVALSNGSIIGARVLVVSNFAQSAHINNAMTFPDFNGTVTNPAPEIGQISLSGYGGIIGSEIGAHDVGSVSVRRGFGIMTTRFLNAGQGSFASINAEGYGIRNSHLQGGANLGAISASAKPRNISTAEYEPSARLSERFDIDPFFNQAPNLETDLHMVLGTSARRPQVKRVTDTGVIADTILAGNSTASSITAAQIRASQFNFGNQISKIKTTGVIDGLRLTTGRLKSFTSGNSSFGLNFSVAGPIDDFRIVGDMDQTSSVAALGPTGRITNFIVDGTMNGDASSSNSFHLLAVGKDLGAPALVKAKTLDEQRIRGDVFGTVQIG